MRSRVQMTPVVHSGIATLALGILLPLTGCVSVWQNAFLDPTKVGNYRENLVTEIQTTISFRDTPPGIAHAVDPKPEDLVAEFAEYEIGPGDVIQVRAHNFLYMDTESTFELVVNELGQVQVPQVGTVHVLGLSSQEFRQKLIDLAVDEGIYRSDPEPTVIVNMLTKLHRRYTIGGSVNQPGAYPIDRPDMTLREAINAAGGLGELVKTIYVFRGERPAQKIREAKAGADAGDSPATQAAADAASVSTPAPEEDTIAVPAAEAERQQTEEQDEGDFLLPAEAEQELIEAVSPTPSTTANDSDVRTQQDHRVDEPMGQENLEPHIFINDEPVPIETHDQSVDKPLADDAADSDEAVEQGDVDWHELATEGQQRIIRIPADRLRNFDSSYNIVIRSNDEIRLDPGPVGNIYIGGEVEQPGPIRLNGDEMTLTQAIITARGLGMLAWPTRCEVRRRIDQNREEIIQCNLERIMSGKDPNMYLRPNDVVMIGTHAIAPLLARIRNALRMDYGFSFRYDRNFAEYDTLSGQYFRSRIQATDAGLNRNLDILP